MTKKEIPFECEIVITKDISILRPSDNKVMKYIYKANLLIRPNNLFRKTYFVNAVNAIDLDNKPHNWAVVFDVLFDPSDNTLATYVNNKWQIVNYKLYGQKTHSQKDLD